jgi:hypothetical protein
MLNGIKDLAMLAHRKFVVIPLITSTLENDKKSPLAVLIVMKI